MANKSLFKRLRDVGLPRTNIVNRAGGNAYAFGARHALAQYAATGCLNGAYYASARDQLEEILKLARQLSPAFVARTAVFARQRGFMKDLPALLCAVLATESPELLTKVFDRVIDSPKMLRNFVQIVRSGVTGRRSLGTAPKRCVLAWLAARTDEQLFIGSVGNDPSLADVVKMVHPKPQSAARAALYGYLIGREHDAAALPPLVQEYERFKAATGSKRPAVPDVPFQLLTALKLSTAEWKGIARNAPWQMTRMNLNTFLRHGVFEDREITNLVAERLKNPELVRKARVFPYQLLAAYRNAADELPRVIREALQDALEVATANVPVVKGKVYILPDVSGSMHCAVTGYRPGASSQVRCVDVAALVAAAMLRTNPTAEVIPFETKAIEPERLRLNPRDTVMTNAEKLASLPAGGTNCSAPLALLNGRKATGDLVVYVSDNESWIDSKRRRAWGGSPTETLRQWKKFKERSPQARMVCIDIQPNSTTQAPEREDIINVGGFSDEVFNVLAAVAGGEADAGYWVRQIEALSV